MKIRFYFKNDFTQLETVRKSKFLGKRCKTLWINEQIVIHTYVSMTKLSNVLFMSYSISVEPRNCRRT